MVLFYENESKYYALLTHLINAHKSFNSRQLEELMETYCHETDDYKLVDMLFHSGVNKESYENKGERVNYFFKRKARWINDKKIDLYTKNEALEHIPVSFTTIELQAAQNMARNMNAKRFLKPETIDKLAETFGEIPTEWSEEDIIVRRKYSIDGDIEKESPNDVKLIADAIRNGKSIIYDYETTANRKRVKEEAYPIKIHYSNIDSLFRVEVYTVAPAGKSRFSTLRLINLSNLQYGNKRIPQDIQQEYLQKRKSEMKTVKLRVQPIRKTVERCFMMFSYYSRTATYDADKNEYILEIEYSEDDVNELIRNLLSLGPAVTVLEPVDLRNRVVDRIRNTIANYADEIGKTEAE